jgi:hypothetical protein
MSADAERERIGHRHPVTDDPFSVIRVSAWPITRETSSSGTPRSMSHWPHALRRA